MSQNIRSVPLGSVYYQSGNGYPTHIATKGCTYIDVNTGIEYINKDGLINWVSFLDGSMVITGTTTPTLQQVLDNNHDLVDGNNFQGTDAGDGNLGVEVIGIGTGAVKDNEGSVVVALGANSGSENTGNDLNAIGSSAGVLNSGQSVIAIGVGSGYNNSAWHSNFFGTNAGLNNIFKNVNLFGYNATADADNQTVFSKWVSGITKYLARLSFNNITADRKWELPNASGTIALTSDIPTIDATPTDGSSNAVSSNGVFDALALTPKIIIRNITPSSALSGTTSETQISSFNFTISANTFSATDILKIETLAWEKSGTTNASTCRLKLSNTNNYATASNVLILAASTNNINMRGTRTYKIAGGNLKGLMSSSANGIFNDNTLTNLAVSTLALDVTQPIYGFVSLNNTSSADATIVNELIITKW